MRRSRWPRVQREEGPSLYVPVYIGELEASVDLNLFLWSENRRTAGRRALQSEPAFFIFFFSSLRFIEDDGVKVKHQGQRCTSGSVVHIWCRDRFVLRVTHTLEKAWGLQSVCPRPYNRGKPSRAAPVCPWTFRPLSPAAKHNKLSESSGLRLHPFRTPGVWAGATKHPLSVSGGLQRYQGGEGGSSLEPSSCRDSERSRVRWSE
ncbi:unnamed protein product [Pleuronectes platessa]|uniref:Uncharacterized protein n=1 Tax=Pleuronectes platessa TaxID=8262 RepID=A0A9N7YE25_PLEPL|nr:unnamed protein product [Pleuronectes platessa]